jgi:hypothetical protein
VAQRLALGERAGADVQGALGAADGTEASAVGARSLGAEQLGLLFHQGSEGVFREAGGGGRGDLLHGVEVDVGARPGLAEGVPGHDLAPARGQVPDLLELVRGELATRHGQSCLVLVGIEEGAFLRLL